MRWHALLLELTCNALIHLYLWDLTVAYNLLWERVRYWMPDILQKSPFKLLVVWFDLKRGGCGGCLDVPSPINSQPWFLLATTTIFSALNRVVLPNHNFWPSPQTFSSINQVIWRLCSAEWGCRISRMLIVVIVKSPVKLFNSFQWEEMFSIYYPGWLDFIRVNVSMMKPMSSTSAVWGSLSVSTSTWAVLMENGRPFFLTHFPICFWIQTKFLQS